MDNSQRIQEILNSHSKFMEEANKSHEVLMETIGQINQRLENLINDQPNGSS